MEKPLFDSLPFASAADGLRALWREAFADDDAFVDAFFGTFSVPDVVHTLSLGGKVVSALYALPCNLCVGGELLPAAYIYAVATCEASRGKGYMTLLLERVEELLRARGVKMLFLLPADEGLRSMYARLGYSDCSQVAVEECRPAEVPAAGYSFAEVCEFSSVSAFWERCACGNSPAVIPSPQMLAMNLVNCRMTGGGLFAAYDEGVLAALAFVINDGGRLVVLDAVSCNTSAQEFLFAALCERFALSSLWRVTWGKGLPHCMCRLLEPSLAIPRDGIKISLLLDK